MLAAGLFTLTACNKPKPPPVAEVGGVKLDLPQFQQAFSGSSQFDASVAKISMGLRYRQYPDVLKSLQSLANDPGLNDQQKKAVADLTDEVKQLMEKPPTP